MPEINLLPQEEKPKGAALKLSKSLRKISLLSVVVFVLLLAGAVSTYVFFSLQTGILNKKENELKSQIKTLEATEQKLILIEDRIAGVEKIINSSSSKEQIESIQKIVDKEPTEVTIKGAKISKDKSVVTISSPDSNNLANFFSSLKNSDFSNVNLDSLTYDGTAYTADINIK